MNDPDSFEEISVTGSWGLRYNKHSPIGKYKFDWPSGKIVVRDRELIFDANEPFGRIYRLIGNRLQDPIPIVVPIDKIRALKIRDDWLSSAAIVSDDPNYELLRFGAFRNRFRRVIERLESLGVPLE